MVGDEHICELINDLLATQRKTGYESNTGLVEVVTDKEWWHGIMDSKVPEMLEWQLNKCNPN